MKEKDKDKDKFAGAGKAPPIQEASIISNNKQDMSAQHPQPENDPTDQWENASKGRKYKVVRMRKTFNGSSAKAWKY